MPGILTQLLLNKHDNICRMYGILIKELRCSFIGMPEKVTGKIWEKMVWILHTRCWNYTVSHRRCRNCFHYSVYVLQFINNIILIENKIFYIKSNNLKSNYLNQILSEACGWSNFTLYWGKLYLQSTLRSEMPINFTLSTLRDKIKLEEGRSEDVI